MVFIVCSTDFPVLKLLDLFQFNIQMHAPYILLKSYKDPIKDNINTDSYVSNYHFGINHDFEINFIFLHICSYRR